MDQWPFDDSKFNDVSANLFKQSYYQGFVDISGDLSVRNTGGIDASGMDISGLTVIRSGDFDISSSLTIQGNLQVFQDTNASIIDTITNDYSIVVKDDISLNGDFRVSGRINNDFYYKNTMQLPYIVADWGFSSHGGTVTTANYHLMVDLFNQSQIYSNINSSQFNVQRNSSTGGNDNYMAFRVFPGLWELHFSHQYTSAGAGGNTSRIQNALFTDTTGDGNTDTETSVSFMNCQGNGASTFQEQQMRVHFYLADGPSAYLRTFYNNSRNSAIYLSVSGGNYIPIFILRCLEVGNWNGENPSLSTGAESGATDYSPSNSIIYNDTNNFTS
jgi:hypothetical protein